MNTFDKSETNNASKPMTTELHCQEHRFMNAYETLHPGIKCPECRGRGKIFRHVPAHAIAMPGVPDDWTYEDQTCWRCHGDGVARSLGVARCSNAPGERRGEQPKA